MHMRPVIPSGHGLQRSASRRACPDRGPESRGRREPCDIARAGGSPERPGDRCAPEAGSSNAVVAAAIINYNGVDLLKECLDSLLAQRHPVSELVVIDNRSTDQSVALVREAFPAVRLIALTRNTGYAAAANVAIRETRSPYLLLLNPDVVLTPTFIGELVGFAEKEPEAGSLTGKLLRFPHQAGGRVIDSTGHVAFRSRWVVNRGEGEEDRGQYDEPAEVFGVSGAAPLYRRDMLEDIRIDGEVFAESFFLYLEDVDVDWRLDSARGKPTTSRALSATTSGGTRAAFADAIPRSSATP